MLQLIAIECYRIGEYWTAAKAFDMLEKFSIDPNPEYWEGKVNFTLSNNIDNLILINAINYHLQIFKRGSCVGGLYHSTNLHRENSIAISKLLSKWIFFQHFIQL